MSNIPDDITPEELKLFNDWQAAQRHRPGPIHEPAERINQFIQSELSNRTPVTMPREYIWAAGAAGIVLIFITWPSLILGAIVGAFSIHKLGCPCNKKEK